MYGIRIFRISLIISLYFFSSSFLKKNEFNFLISLQDSKHSKLGYAWIILEI